MAEEKNVVPVRLGIIGSGLAVKMLHWPALERLKEQFAIVQTSDVVPEAAQEVAEMAGGVPWTTRYQEVLANKDVDAVLLSLPIHLNAQFILEAARAGKHVICEKPLASSWEQAVTLVKALENVPVLVEIAENYHYKPSIQKAKEWIAAGRIGDVFLVQVLSYGWTDVSKGFASTPWRQDNQYRGGVLADACVHEMAALRELGGDVEQLQAFVKSVHPVMGGYETLVLNVRYRSGALGQLTYTGAAKPGKLAPSGMVIFGTEGTIRLEDNGAVLTRPAAGAESGGKEDDSERFTTEKGQGGGYYEEFLNFYNAIRNGEAIVSTPAVALRDWELVMRALDSAEGREVILL